MNKRIWQGGVGLFMLLLVVVVMWPVLADNLPNYGWYLMFNTVTENTAADRNLMAAAYDPADPSTMTGTTSASSLRAIVGGHGHTIGAATGATILGGADNTVPDGAHYALATGQAATARHQGGHTISSGQIAAAGDAQATRIVLRRQTTSDTALVLQAGTAALTVPQNSSWAFWGLCTARRTDADGESALYEFKGGLDRGATGDAALVGLPIVDELHEDSDWTLDISINGSDLEITGQGEALKTVNWVCHMNLSEVIG